MYSIPLPQYPWIHNAHVTILIDVSWQRFPCHDSGGFFVSEDPINLEWALAVAYPPVWPPVSVWVVSAASALEPPWSGGGRHTWVTPWGEAWLRLDWGGGSLRQAGGGRVGGGRNWLLSPPPSSLRGQMVRWDKPADRWDNQLTCQVRESDPECQVIMLQSVHRGLAASNTATDNTPPVNTGLI